MPSTRITYDINDPPCDKCAYKKECRVECQAFRSYMYWGTKVEPPRLEQEKESKVLTHE